MACGTRLGIQGQRNEEEEEASIGLQRRTVVDGWTHVLIYLCSVALVALDHMSEYCIVFSILLDHSPSPLSNPKVNGSFSIPDPNPMTSAVQPCVTDHTAAIVSSIKHITSSTDLLRS
jgi:hypothetical protein